MMVRGGGIGALIRLGGIKFHKFSINCVPFLLYRLLLAIIDFGLIPSSTMMVMVTGWRPTGRVTLVANFSADEIGVSRKFLLDNTRLACHGQIEWCVDFN